MPHNFGLDWLTDVLLVFPHQESVSPGDEVVAHLTFLVPGFQSNRLYEGFTFSVWEFRDVGHGEILEVLRPELQR